MEKFLEKQRVPYLPKGLNEYSLVIAPAGEVYDRVMEEKRYFCLRYDQPGAVIDKPRIAVADFRAWDSMEGALIHRLEQVFREVRSFQVNLNNFSGAPPHTVFIRVQDPQPLRELASRLGVIAPYIKEKEAGGNETGNRAHVAVARELPPLVYEHAIREYAQKDFSAAFEVTELVLLRRQGQRESCQQVSVFRLRSREPEQSKN
jgi:2'-5' RNA ligase